MTLSPTLRYSLLVWGVASASAQNVRGGGRELLGFRRFTTAPHEVHQYEQVKYFNEPDWDCKQRSVGDNVGCLQCYNPGRNVEGLVVEVKSMYKRQNFNIKDETVNAPRKHCIWPNRGSFWTCFNSNLVIEPDTDWLGDFSDKPIYNSDGSTGGSQCLPNSIVQGLSTNGAIFL